MRSHGRLEPSRETSPNLSKYKVQYGVGNKHPYIFFLRPFTMLSVLIMVLEYHHVYHSLNGYLRVTRALIFISWFFPRALGVRSTSERAGSLHAHRAEDHQFNRFETSHSHLPKPPFSALKLIL
jgi:hypothetical protein